MPSLVSDCDLVTIYTIIDDTVSNCDKPAKVGRPSTISNNELVTILVYNTLFLRQKNLKDIWKFINKYHRVDFPQLPKYAAFVNHAHRVMPLLANIISQTFVHSKVNFADSTILEVSKLHRVNSHKVAKNIAKFGKNHQGWHYGFKLHSAINSYGLFSSLCFSGADMYDAQMLPRLVKDYMKVIVGDSHYGASVMRKHIWDKYKIRVLPSKILDQ